MPIIWDIPVLNIKMEVVALFVIMYIFYTNNLHVWPWRLKCNCRAVYMGFEED
jgi:hypothetical protein